MVVLNPRAGGGRARSRFESVHATLARRFELRVVDREDWSGEVRRASSNGVDLVIAAGGDGTVHEVANEMIRAGVTVPLGAIGLGSSNDFHKGFSARVEGVPMRIDADGAIISDVVRVRADAAGERATRHFVVSASCGAVAAGNARFNHPGRLLAWLKQRSPDLAVMQASMETVLGYRPTRLWLAVDGQPKGWRSVATLSLLKTPWLAGQLHFDTPVAPDSGWMRVNLFESAGRAGLLKLLAALRRGEFRRLMHAQSWCARDVELRFDRAEPFELDGELIEAQRIHASVLPRRLALCA
jgi:diacylglycerol kinase family enzyme